MKRPWWCFRSSLLVVSSNGLVVLSQVDKKYSLFLPYRMTSCHLNLRVFLDWASETLMPLIAWSLIENRIFLVCSFISALISCWRVNCKSDFVSICVPITCPLLRCHASPHKQDANSTWIWWIGQVTMWSSSLFRAI